MLKTQNEHYHQANPEESSYNEAMKRQKMNIYFFYGSLMDPSTLQSILGIRDPPTLEPAILQGHRLKMWGRYPALLKSESTDKVYGMVFGISEFEHVDGVGRRLQEYEGPNYRLVECDVTVRGGEGEIVKALTFEWVGGMNELREGGFDLKDWRMRKLEGMR